MSPPQACMSPPQACCRRSGHPHPPRDHRPLRRRIHSPTHLRRGHPLTLNRPTSHRPSWRLMGWQACGVSGLWALCLPHPRSSVGTNCRPRPLASTPATTDTPPEAPGDHHPPHRWPSPPSTPSLAHPPSPARLLPHRTPADLTAPASLLALSQRRELQRCLRTLERPTPMYC